MNKFHRLKWGKMATMAAIGVDCRWPSYPMYSTITCGNGCSIKVLFRRENARCHNQNDSLQQTYGMFRNRIPSKSNNGRHAYVLCLLFYFSDRLIYDILNFGIRVPNMIAQKLKNTPVHSARAV